jgi:hypothetical protein
MNVEVIRSFLLWCTVINYAILVTWFLLLVLLHDPIQRLHGRWFHFSDSQFNALHYGAMAVYKLGILLFNLVPFAVLCIV